MKTSILTVFFVALAACGQPEISSVPPAPQKAMTTPTAVAADLNSLAGAAVTQPSQEAEPKQDLTGIPITENMSAGESKAETSRMHYVPPPYYGPTTMAQRIVDADLIILGRVTSVTSRVEDADLHGQTGYVGALRFTFAVQEAYKSPAGSTSPTSITAMVPSLNRVDTRAEAQQVANQMLAERDTQWDDRNAIVFLASFSLEYPATKSDDLYFMSVVDYEYGFGDHYSLASKWNRMWLPEAVTANGSERNADERWFLTSVPEQQSGQGAAGTSTKAESPIALSQLKAEINSLATELGAGTSIGYRECLIRKYNRKRMEAIWAERSKTYGGNIQTFNVEINSGLPAGTKAFTKSLKAVLDENGWESKSEFIGQDADVFILGELTNTQTRTTVIRSSSRALIKILDYQLSREPLMTTRPLPNGIYNLIWKFWQSHYILCDPDYFHSQPLIITVTAPVGTLHEAFFDPVTVGSAIAADATNGILKPTAFTDGNSVSATLQRITWEAPSTGSGQAGTVKLKLTPHTGLANHVVDFIGLDGSVILSLDADDATVDAANNTLSWPATYQPWNDGDKLMLRIHNGPVTPVPTPTPGPTPAAPTGLTATAGAGSVTLTWNNPSDSTITGYEYQSRWTGVVWQPWKAISGSGSSTTSHTVTGLTGGTEYRFHLRAVNANGSGTAAPNADPWYVAATPSVPPPAAPTGLTATAGRESVKLSWNNPSDSTITRYEYQARWTGVGWQSWKAIPNSDSSTTSHLVTGLTGGTEYRFKIRAVNASGAGPQAPNADPWYVSATPGKR